MDAESPRSLPLALWALAGGAVGTMTAATVVNVAMPSVIGAFSLGQEEAQWLSSAFLVSSTACMLLNTWVTAVLGMRGAFLAAMAVFATGSVVGAGSSGFETAIAARVMQGAGAGLVQPMAMILIHRHAPPDRRASMTSLYALAVIASPALGPVLGGALIDRFDWRVVFVATLPAIAAAVTLAASSLPRRPRRAPIPPLDIAGLALLVIALAMTLQSLAVGHREGWSSAQAQLRMFAAAGASLGFLAWEARQPYPLLHLRLFTTPAFAAAGLVILFSGVAVYGSTYLIPMFVQTAQRMTPLAAGQVMLPAGLAMILAFPLSGRLADKLPPQGVLIAGAGMFALSAMLLSGVTAATSFTFMAGLIAFNRFAIGVLLPPTHACAMRAADPSLIIFAAPALTFLTQVGGALGVAALSVVVQERAAFHAVPLAAGINETLSSVPHALNAGANLSTLAWAQAQTFAFRDGFFLLGAGFALLTALIPLLPRPAPKPDAANFTNPPKPVLTLIR